MYGRSGKRDTWCGARWAIARFLPPQGGWRRRRHDAGGQAARAGSVPRGSGRPVLRSASRCGPAGAAERERPPGRRGEPVQDTRVDSNQPELAPHESDRVGARAAAYFTLAAALLVLYLAVRGLSWQGTPRLHGLLELSATLLALIIGLLALVRYYSRKNVTLLLIGAGFLGTAVLDSYHLVAGYGAPRWLAAGPEDAAAWSWFASRLFLSIILLWSWAVWRREVTETGRVRPPEIRFFLEVAGLTLTSIALFALVRLPSPVHPDSFLPRPLELIPGGLFAFSLVGYLTKGNWRNRPFEVWLVPALIVGVATQTLFMPWSRHGLDALAIAAHGLKIGGYGLVLAGLLSSMYGLYRQLERSACVIKHTNEALRTEIDERIAAEKAVRESEERYRGILETIQEGYFEVDLAGNFTFWNESLARLLGRPPEELRRMNYRRYTEEPYSSALFDTFDRVYRTGEPVSTFGWEIIRGDGGRRYAEASAAPIREPKGEIVGFRGIIRDVTDRRQAETQLEQRSRELARSNEELRQFTSIASHDLQEPLRMVAGYTQLLARRYQGRLDEEADQFIQYAVDGVQRMQRLIRDLLSYSRVQTHGREPESVDAGEPLAWALSNLEAAISEARAEVTRDPMPVVRADPTQLGQLFQNLIANAVKFRGGRPLRVHVGVERRPSEWVFSVRDNGVGIDLQYQGRIFEIFQRIHPRDELDGTGIGLAICKRIVDRHGGRIWVESVRGSGATFYFTIPVPFEDRTGSPAEGPEPPDPPGREAPVAEPPAVPGKAVAGEPAAGGETAPEPAVGEPAAADPAVRRTAVTNGGRAGPEAGPEAPAEESSDGGLRSVADST